MLTSISLPLPKTPTLFGPFLVTIIWHLITSGEIKFITLICQNGHGIDAAF